MLENLPVNWYSADLLFCCPEKMKGLTYDLMKITISSFSCSVIINNIFVLNFTVLISISKYSKNAMIKKANKTRKNQEIQLSQPQNILIKHFLFRRSLSALIIIHNSSSSHIMLTLLDKRL